MTVPLTLVSFELISSAPDPVRFPFILPKVPLAAVIRAPPAAMVTVPEVVAVAKRRAPRVAVASATPMPASSKSLAYTTPFDRKAWPPEFTVTLPVPKAVASWASMRPALMVVPPL